MHMNIVIKFFFKKKKIKNLDECTIPLSDDTTYYKTREWSSLKGVYIYGMHHSRATVL